MSYNSTTVYDLAAYGPLTAEWKPPSSCLRTTTWYASGGPVLAFNRYFVGHQELIGKDDSCYPALIDATATRTELETTTLPTARTTLRTTTSTISATTALTSIFPSYSRSTSSRSTFTGAIRTYTETLNYYSPGVCPSGYSYAASFTGNVDLATKPQNLYLCCPSGYTVSTTTSRTTVGTLVLRNREYLYPSCERSVRSMSNLWPIEQGWPTSMPSVLTVTSTTVRRGGAVFVEASGLAVGWDESDSQITEYLATSNVALPTLPTVSTSTIRPSTSRPSNSRPGGLPGGAWAGIVIGGVLAFVILICCCTCWCSSSRGSCCSRRKWRKEREIMLLKAEARAPRYAAPIPQVQYVSGPALSPTANHHQDGASASLLQNPDIELASPRPPEPTMHHDPGQRV